LNHLGCNLRHNFQQFYSVWPSTSHCLHCLLGDIHSTINVVSFFPFPFLLFPLVLLSWCSIYFDPLGYPFIWLPSIYHVCTQTSLMDLGLKISNCLRIWVNSLPMYLMNTLGSSREITKWMDHFLNSVVYACMHCLNDLMRLLKVSHSITISSFSTLWEITLLSHHVKAWISKFNSTKEVIFSSPTSCMLE